MNQNLEPIDLSKNRIDHYYRGVDNTKNYLAQWRFPENSKKATLILVTGMEDPTPLWVDTVKAAQQEGFQNIFIVEIRGQGQSERVPGNTTKLIHVESFQDYSTDMLLAFKKINDIEKPTSSVYIISHSTGSLVIGDALKQIQTALPHLSIKAMAFWSPLVALPINAILSHPLLVSTISILNTLYRKCCGLFKVRSFKPESFAENKLTTDPEKYQLSQSFKREHPMGSSGISLHWIIEAIKATQYFQSETINQLSVPTLIIKAENDTVVSNDYQYNNSLVSEWTALNAKHALHIEQDAIFKKIYQRSFHFFRKMERSLENPAPESDPAGF